MFVLTNAKYFEGSQMVQIRELLVHADDSKWSLVQSTELKDPTISLILSLFFGGIGVDRFVIGDVGLGIGKLLTCGGLGVWALVDLFLIMGATRDKNFAKIIQVL